MFGVLAAKVGTTSQGLGAVWTTNSLNLNERNHDLKTAFYLNYLQQAAPRVSNKETVFATLSQLLLLTLVILDAEL